MESLYLANSTQTEPTPPRDTASGYPTDGSSTGGVKATVPGAFWYHGVTMEQVNVIREGGLTPDRNNNAQMALAIRAMINQAKAELQAQISAISDQLFAPGTIAFFGTASAPVNWLICNGQAVSRESYPELFSALGTRFGKGDGATTFNLPNLVGRFPQGATSGIGGTVAAGLPDIRGQFCAARTGVGDRPSFVGNGAFSEAGRWDASVHHGGADDWGSIYQFKASDSNSIYGASSTVQPPALKLLPCIHI